MCFIYAPKESPSFSLTSSPPPPPPPPPPKGMGTCHSCESTSVATAKLILQDGKLQEFSYPVKASHVLQTDPTCFICNSDEMEFEDLLPAINADEELQPGQLYFALPLSRLRYPLQAEEMAALAVKASAALRKSCRDRCEYQRRRAVAPVVFQREEGSGARRGVAEEKKRVGRGSGRNFASKLNAIPE